MNYHLWNKSIIQHFFHKEFSGREVILFVDDNVINEIGNPLGSDINDFLAEVRSLENTNSTNICINAYRLFSGWRQRYKYPPYVAYLALFVMAAGVDGEFAEHAYYPRLRSLLGLDEEATIPQFNLMCELWYDLELWSREEKRGRFGNFTVRIHGKWRHVGIPRSQLLITKVECDVVLPKIFYENSFDPLDLPPEQELISALVNSAHISVKTKSILYGTTEYLRNALLEVVTNELEQWDGLNGNNGEEATKGGSIKPVICLSYDKFSEQVSTVVRIKSTREFPDDELEYRMARELETLLYCFGSVESFSSPLYFQHSQTAFSASNFDWFRGERLVSKDSRWTTNLSGSAVRIFKQYHQLGFGWVELQKIETNTPYFISFHDSLYTSLTMWADEHCAGYTLLSTIGLPEGWHLCQVNEIRESHPEIQLLKLPVLSHLRFESGIKSQKGNYYFSFALPNVTVEGRWDGNSPTINGIELESIGHRRWRLPNSLKTKETITVELNVGNTVKKLSLILQEPSISKDLADHKRDKYAVISNQCPTGSSQNITECNYMQCMAKRIIYIGKIPGQIIYWPREELEDSWEPIWAIIKTDDGSWTPQYIAGQQDTLPILNQRIKNWKKWRKAFRLIKIAPIKSPLLRELWQAYRIGAEQL